MFARWISLAAALFLAIASTAAAEPLRVGTFVLDATPPAGSPLCDGLCPPVASVDDSLSARGVVLVGAGKPIVLVAFDWVGIGNAGYDAFRAAVARAVGTDADRVAIHSLHQHDAPGCDFETEAILAQHGLAGASFNVAHARKQIEETARAAQRACDEARPITHIGLGKAKIEQVAAARRVVGPDDKVKYTRNSTTRNPEARAEPEGVIDPFVQLLSFWDGDRPLAVLSYYATHPMSTYGKGCVSADFIGLARNAREQVVGTPHIHFNGAGGNVTAGKYNDGSPGNRELLTQRVAAGMAAAWDATQKTPVTSADVDWRVEPVVLPLSPRYVDQAATEASIDDAALTLGQRVQFARHLAFARRASAKQAIPLQRLKIGPAYVLHMPGELFVEYQLAAQAMRPGEPVLMAAYGDYGCGYIGMKCSYPQGGYETGAVSRVAPEVEDVLMPAMRKLLGVP
jgi:hypothetical protein